MLAIRMRDLFFFFIYFFVNEFAVIIGVASWQSFIFCVGDNDHMATVRAQRNASKKKKL